MKKALFLLLVTIASYGQTLQNPTFGNTVTNTLKIKANTATAETSRLLSAQPSDGTVSYIDAVNLPLPTSVINAIKQKADLSTGLLKNGLISINADPTKLNVSAGIGVISNFDDPQNPVSTIINFPAFTGITPAYLNTGNITYVAINSTPTIVMQATPFTPIQRRDLILLGAVVHSNLININVVNNISAPSNAIGNQLHDFIEAVGALNLTGNKYSANGANLSLNKSAGTIFKFGVNFATNWKDPHELSQSAGTALTFRYRTQNGTEGSDVTVINPALYDLNNVLTAVPNNKFSIQTVTMFQTGLTRIQYGQNFYDDLASAQAAIFTRDFNVEANIKENGITRAYIIVKNNTTSLQNVSDSKIIEAQKFGGIASGGVALTFANVVSALGYTPENVANKQNSLVNDGTGVKYPTVDVINKTIGYVTPEQFGAIGDGVTNDNTAVQNAINTGKAVLLSKTYLVTGLTIPANASLQGLGKGVLKITSNSYILNVLTKDVTISGLTFIGSGRDTGSTNQNAIQTTGNGADNTIVSDCRFFDFGGSAFLNEDNGNRQSGSTVSNSFIHNCNYGIRLFNEGEYNSFVGVSVEDCNFGFHNSAGNNTFTGGRLIENGTNVYLGTGVNDGHGVISASTINHGANYNVYTTGVVNNFLFDGCMLYLGNVSINNSNGIRFNSCEFSLFGFTLTLDTNSNAIFESSKFATWGGYSLTGTEALWHDNTFPNQQPPSSIINRMTGINISYSQNLGLGTITPDVFTRSYDKIFGIYGSGTAGIEINGNSNHANLDLGTSGVRRFNINTTTSSNSVISIANPLYINVNSGIRAAFFTTGRIGFGTLTDNGIDIAQFNGTISVSNATNNNQAVNKGQLDTGLALKSNDADVVHRTGGIIESISGEKTFLNTIKTSASILFAGTSIGTDPDKATLGRLGDDISIASKGLINYASLSTSLLTASRTYSFPNSSGTIALTSDLATSGTYTPTLTNVVNTSGLVLNNANYIKVGNIVTVTIGFEATLTSATTDSSFTVSLPINRNVGTNFYMGSGSLRKTGLACIPVFVDSVEISKARVLFVSGGTAGDMYAGSVSFQYISN